MDIHERIKAARIKAGYPTAKAAAARLATPYGTYSGHESGKRGVKADDIARYAKLYKVSVPWLTHGVGENELPVPVVGYVGAGGQAVFNEGQGPFDTAQRPPGLADRGAALLVRGESMPGVAEDGWLVFYEDRREPVEGDLIGHLCVCALEDGRVLVKKLFPGTTGSTWTLSSVLGAPIRDVSLQWAAKVAWIKPQ